MIIQLLKQGAPVLTARTEHNQTNAARDLPVRYDGDTSLLPPTLHLDDTWDVGILSTMFRRIADEHKLEITGDYVGMRKYGSVDFTGYQPEPGYVEESEESEEENKG